MRCGISFAGFYFRLLCVNFIPNSFLMRLSILLTSFSIRGFILMLAFAFSISFASAQNSSWDEEEDEEEGSGGSVEVKEDLSKYDVALILVNGKQLTITPEISVPKNDTMDISVRHLQPNSHVSVEIKKGSVVLKKTGFNSNEKGELDLAVLTGGKMSGGATISYFAGSGKKVSIDVKIKIE